MEPWVLKVLQGLAEFPYAHVCRHWVAMEILGTLEEAHQVGTDKRFVALVEAFGSNSEGDEEASRLCQM